MYGYEFCRLSNVCDTLCEHSVLSELGGRAQALALMPEQVVSRAIRDLVNIMGIN